MVTSGLSYANALSFGLRPRESGQLSTIIPQKNGSHYKASKLNRFQKRKQNNNRPINLPQGNNILHTLHVHHITQNFISRAYTIFNNCCIAMYVTLQSARMHEHWRKLTYDDWTLLITLFLLFRLESLPFLNT